MCLGIPGQIVEIVDPADQRATVDVAGGIKVGDWVLIHVGFAMTKIDEEEAASTLDFIKQLGRIYDDEMRDFSAEAPL
jgi:hydrogenase expression/formation protein HypC